MTKPPAMPEPIKTAVSKLKSAQMCNPNAVQHLIEEALAALQSAQPAEPEQSTRLRGGVPSVPEAYAKAMDALLDFAQTVGGSSSFWDDVWPEHEAAMIATAAPQAPALDAGVVRDAWRLLETGDRIESADEVLHDDCVTWGSLVGWEVGATYNTTLFMPIRRKVLAAMSAQGGA